MLDARHFQSLENISPPRWMTVFTAENNEADGVFLLTLFNGTNHYLKRVNFYKGLLFFMFLRLLLATSTIFL
jgi:hypothetical protein